MKEASRIAQTVEGILYSRSDPREDHSDPQYVNQRLRSLLNALKHRKEKKQAESAASDRETFLRDLLGLKKYKQVRRLVDEIKLERLKKVAEGCTRCKKLEDGTMVCPRPQKPGVLPCEVRALFFGAELMDAIKFHSTQAWKDVDWDKLAEGAEEILLKYRSWSQRQTAPVAAGV
jgi:hypothetical protein